MGEKHSREGESHASLPSGNNDMLRGSDEQQIPQALIRVSLLSSGHSLNSFFAQELFVSGATSFGHAMDMSPMLRGIAGGGGWGVAVETT